jgi:uncharacterized repeat protein (TIGR01451 family)
MKYMAIINNQAQISFHYGTHTGSAISNIASTNLEGPLTASKNALESVYHRDQQITYIVTINNTGATALSNVVIVDNLGTTSLGSINITPLDYIGPAMLYINGSFVSTLSPTVATDSVTFTILTLPAHSNAMIIYAAKVNDQAPLAVGSLIINRSALTADGLTDPVIAFKVLLVDEYADVDIIKAMSPNPVIDGSLLTYAFTMYNYGNTLASSAVLSDTFTPAPESISTVSVNGTPVLPADYSFVGGVFRLPALTSTYSLTIPAATFTRDPVTGIVTVSPGTTTVEVSGII